MLSKAVASSARAQAPAVAGYSDSSSSQRPHLCLVIKLKAQISRKTHFLAVAPLKLSHPQGYSVVSQRRNKRKAASSTSQLLKHLSNNK